MRKEFLLLDTDGDGSISTEEIFNVLKAMQGKFKLTDRAIKTIIKEIDQDGNGTVDVEEYMQNMKNKTNKDIIHRALVQRSSIRKQFQKYDADGSGFITIDEMKEVLKATSNLDFSEYQINKLMEDDDVNNDGKINYEEFVVMMTK